MKLSIMQPAYLPWMGYFNRILRSDIHVILDHVSIDENSKTKFANRNKVRTPGGWTWLTVPIRSKGKHGCLLLNEVSIEPNTPWPKKHLGAIIANYSRTPYFSDHRDFFEEVYTRDWDKLLDLVQVTTDYLRACVGIDCPVLKSSELGVSGQKDELILNICKELGAKSYISGPFGRDYLDAFAFSECGIELVFHEYQHPSYDQAFPGFEPYMSVIDLLFNHGAEKARHILDAPISHE
jgi:hypothetical protein